MKTIIPKSIYTELLAKYTEENIKEYFEVVEDDFINRAINYKK